MKRRKSRTVHTERRLRKTKRPNKMQRTADAEGILRPKKKHKTASPYLVVGHGSVSPAFSVFKVEPYTDGGGTPVGIPRRLARLKCKDGMSFVPLRLNDRRWIVGVGGCSSKDYHGAPGTIIFDTEKQSVIRGPEPKSIKSSPVLLPVGHKIYSLVRTASMTGPLDYLPWFEVLDLSEAQEVEGRLTNCEWRPLERPPFFPWELTPMEFIFPPSVTVVAYAVVGSRILVSVTGPAGVYAFDMNKEKQCWTMVDDKKDLPFVRGAILHGPELFLGLSRTRRAITGYRINVGAGSLSVVEVPVISDLEDEEPVVSTFDFLSLGIDRGFCVMSCWSDTQEPPYLRANIRVRTYKTDDFVESEGKFFVVCKQWMQVYKIRDLIRTLDAPCLVGVVSI